MEEGGCLKTKGKGGATLNLKGWEEQAVGFMMGLTLDTCSCHSAKESSGGGWG